MRFGQGLPVEREGRRAGDVELRAVGLVVGEDLLSHRFIAQAIGDLRG